MKTTITLLFVLILSVAAFAQTTPLTPELIYTGGEEITKNGKDWILYRLEVSNRSEYADELFESAPELPPCGRNKNSARSWVNIYAGNGSRIYGFCDLKSADELGTLTFQMPKGKVPRSGVYIIILDRKTGASYKSKTISLE